ncbi:MAG: hypothetical protein MUF12_00440 [Sediminibacterium sp.]|jgi:hypothetical protein|nr:hypothetical protein [Sediminibacterium sp.]
MEEQINPAYIKAFNVGYILSKHEPKLMTDILKMDNPSNEFFKALKAGQKQFEEEKSLEAIKQTTQKIDKDRGRERVE